MKRIALYGGAFDPPHVGHALVVAKVLNAELVDELWLLPSGERPDKQYESSASARLEMLSLSIDSWFARSPQVRIETSQLKREDASPFTVDHVAYLREQHPDCLFQVVIGSELLAELPTWHEPERLKNEVEFLVVMRPGSKLERRDGFQLSALPGGDEFLCSVSSTEVRALISRGACAAGMLHPDVERYIVENGLYLS